MDFGLPSAAQIEQAIASAQRARQADRLKPSPRTAYMRRATSLRAWLACCAQTNIAAVPARFSPDIEPDDIDRALDGLPAPTLAAACAWLRREFGPRDMWRWDICASLDLKAAMAEGTAPPLVPEVTVDDPRFIDFMMEINPETMWIAARPWVEAEQVDGYPVEFRGFWLGNGAAVSSYYPQRPLGQEWSGLAEQVRDLVARLAAHADLPAFTADFLLAADGSLLFLEGGPALGRAHPCCFKPENVQPGAIALADQDPDRDR